MRFQKYFWRPVYLRKLLHERREMHLRAETNSQKELQSLIDSMYKLDGIPYYCKEANDVHSILKKIMKGGKEF